MIDFQLIKRDINLIDFLVSRYNFVVNESKSSRNGFAVLSDGSENLLVKMQTSGPYCGEWFYMNADNRSKKGNIVMFILERENINIKSSEGIRKFNEIITGDIQPTIYEQKIINADNIEELKLQKNKVLKLSDRAFLYSRGITDSTIDAANFKGKIFNKWAVDDNENYYLNTVFPYFDKLTVKPFTVTVRKGAGENLPNCTGLEIKNSNFGSGNVYSAFTDKTKSLWMSNVDSIKNSIIFPFESSIDALSYFELNSTIHLVKEALFISVGGEYTPGQINSILKILDHAKGLALSNDNDRQGKYFNCKILVAYILKLNIEIELEKISKDSVTIGFDNQYLSIFKNIANIKTFGTIDASMSRVGFMFDFDVKKMGKIEIFLLSIIADLKSDKIIYINNPIEKDFNDDLMKKKGLVKSKVSQAEARENNRVI